VIVIAGLDESYYMAQYEEFHTSPARKDAEGIYHIDGDLVLAAKEAQLKILKLLEPIWELTAGIKNRGIWTDGQVRHRELLWRPGPYSEQEGGRIH
jgi:hypothetical protein